jgi:hypothetical protein
VITIILPTRQRYAGLCRVLRTLRDTASDIANVKVLLKFDTDDIDTYESWMEVWEEFIDFTRTYSWERERGYLDLYKFTNYLASVAPAQTKWLMVTNDDCYFDHKGWDTEILALDHTKPQILQFCPIGLFPCISIAAYKAMGTFSKANHIDTYLSTVGTDAGCLVHLPLRIVHEAHRFEDLVRKEGQASYGKEWGEQSKHVPEDVDRILKYKA